MDGAIDDACIVCEKLCATPINDPRMQLNVRIHKLHELIYTAENIPEEKKILRTEALEEALQYSRELASFALDAFPEAYPMFTESMMLFACPERTSTTELICRRRKVLADEIVSLTKMTVGARESRLSFLVRYLLLIYIQFKAPVRSPGEAFDPLKALIGELLLVSEDSIDRTARILWTTEGGPLTKFGHRGDYKEVDVQALPERVNISRQESIESLRFTDGDVTAALKNELGKVRLSRSRLRQLVVEYCATRGLQVFETGKTGTNTEHGDQFPKISSEQDRIIVPEGMVSESSMKMFSVMCKLRGLEGKYDIEAILPILEEIGHDLLGQAPVLDFRIGQCEVLKHLKQDEFDAALNIIQQRLAPTAKKYPHLEKSITETITLLVFATDTKCFLDATLDIDDKSSSQREPVNEIPSSMRKDMDMVDHEDTSAAETKDNISNSFDAYLSNAIQAVTGSISIDSVTAEAYKAYETKYQAPALLHVLNDLVLAHKEWQTYNMMVDRFSEVMGIAELERGGVGDGSSLANIQCGSTSPGDEKKAGGMKENDSNMNSSTGIREQVRIDNRENIVLTLMEFLAISRAEALAAVRNHPNAESAQTIVDAVFGQML